MEMVAAPTLPERIPGRRRKWRKLPAVRLLIFPNRAFCLILPKKSIKLSSHGGPAFPFETTARHGGRNSGAGGALRSLPAAGGKGRLPHALCPALLRGHHPAGALLFLPDHQTLPAGHLHGPGALFHRPAPVSGPLPAAGAAPGPGLGPHLPDSPAGHPDPAVFPDEHHRHPGPGLFQPGDQGHAERPSLALDRRPKSTP